MDTKDAKFLHADNKDPDQTADVHADLSLCWTHMPESTFPQVPAHVITLLLLNTTCPVLANSVDPDQLASSEAN